MTLRATTQHVEILRAGVPNLRVTGHFLEVLREDTSPPPSPPPVDVVQSLGLNAGQEFTPTTIFRFATDHLGFVEYVGFPQFQNVVQYLNFTPRVIRDVFDSIFSENPLAPLVGSHAYPVQTDDVENNFGWAEATIQVHPVADSLGLTNTVTAGIFRDVTNSLGLEDVADSSPSEYTRDPEPSGFLKQYISYSISGGECKDKDFSPDVGSDEDDGYPVMDTTTPVIVKGDVVLTYPYVTPSLTLSLKSPAFGNTDQVRFNLIDRTNRGGGRIVYNDPNWARDRVLEFEIEHLYREQAEALAAFINESLGAEVGLLDWEGTQWRGIIIAPNSPMTETVGGYAIKIAFQGAEV